MDFMDIAKGAEKAVPKLADVAKDSMDWMKQADKATKFHTKTYTEANSLSDDLTDAENNYFHSMDSGDKKTLNRLNDEYTKKINDMSHNLNTPKGLKSLVDYDVQTMYDNGISELPYPPHFIVDKYHIKTYKMNPDDKKVYDNLVDKFYDTNDGRIDAVDLLNKASDIMPELVKLTPAQQDTFLKLFPEWTGPYDELLVTARLL